MSDFINTSETMGSEDAVLDALIAHNLSEFKDDTVTTLGAYAFYKNNTLTAVELPRVTTVSNAVFRYCTGLISAIFAELSSLGQYMFADCTSLENISFPSLTLAQDYAFQNCTSLQTVTFTNTMTKLSEYMFKGCTGLQTITAPGLTRLEQHCLDGCTSLNIVDFSNVTYVGDFSFNNCTGITSISLPEATSIGSYAFDSVPCGVISLPKVTNLSNYITRGNGPAGLDITNKLTFGSTTFKNSYNLKHLILRSNQMCTLSSSSCFNETPIGIYCGYIYVPADLVETYKTATNWSNFANNIVPITEYPKAPTGSISDTWEQIFQAEQDGTYSTKYSVGDTKVVDIDGTGVLMKIVAMDTDVLASDTTKTAPITWISAGFIEKRAMNATATTKGGWADSAMRTYMRETLFPKIEQTVRLNIKEVNKTYKSVTPTNGVLTATDTVWIPSSREIFGGTTYEDNGPIYSSVFDSAANRIKKEGGYGLGSASGWWLRSAINATNFGYVSNNGIESFSSASSAPGLVLGFCT